MGETDEMGGAGRRGDGRDVEKLGALDRVEELEVCEGGEDEGGGDDLDGRGGGQGRERDECLAKHSRFRRAMRAEAGPNRKLRKRVPVELKKKARMNVRKGRAG